MARDCPQTWPAGTRVERLAQRRRREPASSRAAATRTAQRLASGESDVVDEAASSARGVRERMPSQVRHRLRKAFRVEPPHVCDLARRRDGGRARGDVAAKGEREPAPLTAPEEINTDEMAHPRLDARFLANLPDGGLLW